MFLKPTIMAISYNSASWTPLKKHKIHTIGTMTVQSTLSQLLKVLYQQSPLYSLFMVGMEILAFGKHSWLTYIFIRLPVCRYITLDSLQSPLIFMFTIEVIQNSFCPL